MDGGSRELAAVMGRHYAYLRGRKTQSDEEALAEDEVAYETTTRTAMKVPADLVPVVRELIAKQRAG